MISPFGMFLDLSFQNIQSLHILYAPCFFYRLTIVLTLIKHQLHTILFIDLI